MYGVVLLKAVARAAAEAASLNGYWRDDAFVAADAVNLGVVISLRSGGLAAPALLDAASLDVDALMAALKDATERARRGRLKSSELTSATITVSSLGDIGVEAIYPIIHPPQVAIVGFGAIIDTTLGGRRRPARAPCRDGDARRRSSARATVMKARACLAAVAQISVEAGGVVTEARTQGSDTTGVVFGRTRSRRRAAGSHRQSARSARHRLDGLSEFPGGAERCSGCRSARVRLRTGGEPRRLRWIPRCAATTVNPGTDQRPNRGGVTRTHRGSPRALSTQPPTCEVQSLAVTLNQPGTLTP